MANQNLLERRRNRNRYRLRLASVGKLRLSVFRSTSHIYAQVIDDVKEVTIVSASTLDKELNSLKSRTNMEAAKAVGKLVAERAMSSGVSEVVFDRGEYRYHGRVKALADSARAVGLKF